jgi:hypothetical protein
MINLSSTTFLRISALILLAVGAYGIYSWQMKSEKIREVAPLIPSPWYYFAIPLFLLIIFGWMILAKHRFNSPARKMLLMFAFFCGVAYFAVKTFDTMPKAQWSSPRSEPVNTYTPPPGRTVVTEPQQNYQPNPPPIQQTPPAREVPPPSLERSYEECWQIVRQAYSDDSVAVPPECQQARADYRQMQEEIASQKRQREEEERDRQARAERDRREEEERQRRIAEENRRNQERIARDMEEEQRRKREERERRIREAAEGIKRIFRKH